MCMATIPAPVSRTTAAIATSPANGITSFTIHAPTATVCAQQRRYAYRPISVHR